MCRCPLTLPRMLSGALALVLASAALLARASTQGDALEAVQILRAGGCGGILPAAPPLHPDTLLEQAAAQWAAGRSLNAAAERSGYRSQSLAGVHVFGPESSLIELLRDSGCGRLADRGLHDIGVYARGYDSWVVVGAAYAGYAGHAAYSGPLPTTAAPAFADRALELVNAVRARGARCGDHHLAPAPPVTLNLTLAGVAQGHAQDMAEHDYFEHVDLAGQTPADRVRAVGYRESLVGENIAYGPDTLDEVVQGWLASPGHCENIMDPRFQEMGIAYATGQGSRPGLYWVQLFADPRR